MEQLPHPIMQSVTASSGIRDDSECSSGLPREPTKRYAEIIYSAYENKDDRRFYRNFTSFLIDSSPSLETLDDYLDTKTNEFEKTDHGVDTGRLAALAQLIQMRDIRPDIEDIEGAPISLTGRITLPDPIDTDVLEILEKILALKEEEANCMLEEYSQKYGYRPLFRMAICDLFTSEMANLVETYWRCDRRGQYTRYVSHEICSQAITEFPWLNDAEQRILVRATGCFPEDAEAFWRNTTQDRLSYLLMTELGRIEDGFLMEYEHEEYL